MSIIFDIEKDPVYQEGVEYGEKRGEERGEKRGEERGEKRGEKRGEENKALAVAKVMKQAGEPIDKIAAYTQLSAAEIEQL